MNAEVSYFYSHQVELCEHLSAIDSSDFWRQLNPQLTITEQPFSRDPVFYHCSDTDRQKAVEQVVVDGYLQTQPAIPIERCRALCEAVERILKAGYHPNYVSLYDEYWQTLQGISQILEPVLGPGCHPLGDYWAWCISPNSARSGWQPHRDFPFKRRTLREDGRPQLVTVWLPFSDATTLNGCMYLVPQQWDPNLPDHPEQYSFGGLQDIRALPAAAGSVLAWNQYVMHWGSRCSQFAEGPRISTGIYFQSDVEPYVNKPVKFDQSLPFERRLGFVASNMLNYHQYHDYTETLLNMCFRQVRALPNFAELVPSDLLPLMS